MAGKIKKEAVENFLGSLDMSMKEGDHVANAALDARSYKWNTATLLAIIEGIAQRYRIKEIEKHGR